MIIIGRKLTGKASGLVFMVLVVWSARLFIQLINGWHLWVWPQVPAEYGWKFQWWLMVTNIFDSEPEEESN